MKFAPTLLATLAFSFAPSQAADTTRFSLIVLHSGSHMHFTSPGLNTNNELVIKPDSSPFIGNFYLNNDTIVSEKQHLYLAVGSDKRIVASPLKSTSWSILQPLLNSSPPHHSDFLGYVAYSDGSVTETEYLAVERFDGGGYDVYTPDYVPEFGTNSTRFVMTVQWLNITTTRIAAVE